MSIFRNVLIVSFLAGGLVAANAKDRPEQEFTRTINREFGTTADGMTANKDTNSVSRRNVVCMIVPPNRDRPHSRSRKCGGTANIAVWHESQ